MIKTKINLDPPPPITKDDLHWRYVYGLEISFDNGSSPIFLKHVFFPYPLVSWDATASSVEHLPLPRGHIQHKVCYKHAQTTYPPEYVASAIE